MADLPELVDWGVFGVPQPWRSHIVVPSGDRLSMQQALDVDRLRAPTKVVTIRQHGRRSGFSVSVAVHLAELARDLPPASWIQFYGDTRRSCRQMYGLVRCMLDAARRQAEGRIQMFNGTRITFCPSRRRPRHRYQLRPRPMPQVVVEDVMRLEVMEEATVWTSEATSEKHYLEPRRAAVRAALDAHMIPDLARMVAEYVS